MEVHKENMTKHYKNIENIKKTLKNQEKIKAR